MRIHHGYIGVVLIVWSMVVIGSGHLVIGEYNPWLAWGGLLLGVGLLTHDIWLHTKHRRRQGLAHH